MAMVRGVSEVQANLQKWYSGSMAVVARTAEEIAVILAGWAQTHHKWTPRTGATDVETRAFIAEATPHLIRIIVTAGTEYSIFLELAHNGKWAWLWQAVTDCEGQIKAKLEGMNL